MLIFASKLDATAEMFFLKLKLRSKETFLFRIISDPNNKELIHQEILKRLRDLETKKNSQKSMDNFHFLNAQTWAGNEEDLPNKDDLGPF